jgi:hypothetical protein
MKTMKRFLALSDEIPSTPRNHDQRYTVYAIRMFAASPMGQCTIRQACPMRVIAASTDMQMRQMRALCC